jgi:hypothetical protein
MGWLGLHHALAAFVLYYRGWLEHFLIANTRVTAIRFPSLEYFSWGVNGYYAKIGSDLEISCG